MSAKIYGQAGPEVDERLPQNVHRDENWDERLPQHVRRDENWDETLPPNARRDESWDDDIDINSYQSQPGREMNSPIGDGEWKESTGRPSIKQARSLRNAARSMNFENISTSAVDSRTRRRRGNLPKPITDLLKVWFHEHLAHPYPSEEEKHELLNLTGLNMGQVR